MKQISFFIPLLGTLLLSGCAGTSTVLRSKAGCGITAAPG